MAFNVTSSNTAHLRAWNTANAIKLSGAAYFVWKGTINLTSGTSVQFQHIRKDAAGSVLYEGGLNRTCTPSGTTQARTDT